MIGVVASAVGLAAVLSWAIANRVRVYAIERELLDVPNHRSSHSAPTPRGGGIAIALVTICGTFNGSEVARIVALCG